MTDVRLKSLTGLDHFQPVCALHSPVLSHVDVFWVRSFECGLAFHQQALRFPLFRD